MRPHASFIIFPTFIALMEHTDNTYINALLTNDETLLREFYQKCFGKVSGFVQRNHGTAEDAWDLLQDAMLAVYYKLKQQTFSLTCPFDAFIYILCRNLWLKKIRNNLTLGVTMDAEMVSSVISSGDFEQAEQCRNMMEQKKLLEEKIKLLGDGCRKLLKESWQGKPLQNIAAEMNITYSYARNKKSECMAKLVQLMNESPVLSELK